MLTLNEEFNILAKNNVINDDVPEFVTGNIHYALREYQEEALTRFFHYMDAYDDRQKPTQLLFEMATGSGKTLVMAGCILWLYKQGYRNFIFFTRLGNIIEKTKDNFLNSHSSKYVFDGVVEIDGKQVTVNEVENFNNVNEDDINLVFVTTGKLHNHMKEPRENSLTLEDFEDKDVVLIADEAHNLDAVTKSQAQLSVGDEDDLKHWESTINRIFASQKENVLLEFTATANLENEAVAEKYEDKLLHTYSLREFREDGYSKDVYMTISGSGPLQRALQAIILSQYRRKVAEAHGIALKPVVMFKSQYIYQSEELKEDFLDMIANLSASDITDVENAIDDKAPDLQAAFVYFKENDVTPGDLASELKQAFSDDYCLLVDSINITEEKQRHLNSLEDDNNQYRAIFAVDQLNEGWDVLNLFDIVKMDDSFTKNTTQQERQLIGRGARYCPFGDPETQDYFVRKFDEEANNPLRIIEKLNYHCQYEKDYIESLKDGLRDDGIYPEGEREEKTVKLSLKDEVKESDFYKSGFVFENKLISKVLPNLEALEKTTAEEVYSYDLLSIDIDESGVYGERENKEVDSVREKSERKIKLDEIDTNMLRAGLDHFSIYSYDNLHKLFPELTSLDEFITSVSYLGSIEMKVRGEREALYSMSRGQIFQALLSILGDLAEDIAKEKTGAEGSTTFYPVSMKERIEESSNDGTKTLSVVRTSGEERGVGMRETGKDDLRMDVRKRDWYMFDENYGTSEEKSMVKFIDGAMKEFKEKYEEVYLLRNEKFFKVYDFDKGRRFEPDFLLFMKDKGVSGKKVHYQLFIEPKGDGWREKDMWKQDFLKEIEEKFAIQDGFEYENKDFKLIGLPFYTEDMNDKFEDKWGEVINN